DSYSDSSKQVSMRFFNNTGKDISRIAVTFQPARSLFSLTPPPRVGQFALVERIQNVTLPANQLSSTVTFPSVGTGSEVRAVFLERIILTFSDGTTRAYNSWQVKNMVHEAPVALFPK
ncbi:MAG: hypothetical protein KDK25_16210, partial [Leptospiraceae bacterium]|nr:hypothetical protein [Leptospiraceae bacterium]